jgi:ABC-type antimicrobial peptide transport system permease subunit
VLGFKPLPWEYGIRNLFRRPLRSGLTLCALTTVILLVYFVVGFIRGLEASLARSGDPHVAIVFAQGMGENLEYSSVPMSTTALVSSSVDGILRRYGDRYASSELYLGTQIQVGDGPVSIGLVRGVTPEALLVRRQVEITSGQWPRPGEAIVGRLVAAKVGANQSDLTAGKTVTFEGVTWRISGTFAAAGSVFESEIWCRLDDLQQAMKRQDLSLVALTLEPSADIGDVQYFLDGRSDLELHAMGETAYYRGLREHYGPVRWLAWLVVLLVSGAGVFAGLNTMHGAVMGRVRELATLQTLGFRRRAIVLSLLQEGVVLAATAVLIATGLALVLVRGAAVRFTMGAFELKVDNISVLISCGVGLALGVIGSLPPALRALRLPVVEGLKTVRGRPAHGAGRAKKI